MHNLIALVKIITSEPVRLIESALGAYVNERQKQKAEKIAVKVFQYSECYTLKCF